MNTSPILTILMLGGAKRVSVARMLRQAARARGYELRLLSYELTTREPISVEAAVIPGLRWKDAGLEADLMRIVREYAVNAVIPFVDGAIAPASALALTMPGLYVPAPTPELCADMFDKTAAASRFETCGIPVPETLVWESDDLFPAIAKPRCGSASAGIRVIRTAADLELIPAAERDGYLLQRYIENPVEYTVDCFAGRDGQILAVSPRIRLATAGGEVTRTRTVADPALTAASVDVLKKLDLRGAVTLQWLRPADNPEAAPLLMEINPRLGGGVVCSIHAGADIPGMIIDEMTGRTPRPATRIQPYVEIARYQQEVVFHCNEND